MQLKLPTLSKLWNGYIKLPFVGMFVPSTSLRFVCIEEVMGGFAAIWKKLLVLYSFPVLLTFNYEWSFSVREGLRLGNLLGSWVENWLIILDVFGSFVIVMYYDLYAFNEFFPEQAKWYMKAAEGGYVRAMYNISLCFSFGEGLTRNHQLARKWMKRAADRGHSKAQFEHGLALFSVSIYLCMLLLCALNVCQRIYQTLDVFVNFSHFKKNRTSWHFCWICYFATFICFPILLIKKWSHLLDFLPWLSHPITFVFFSVIWLHSQCFSSLFYLFSSALQ